MKPSEYLMQVVTGGELHDPLEGTAAAIVVVGSKICEAIEELKLAPPEWIPPMCGYASCGSRAIRPDKFGDISAWVCGDCYVNKRRS